MPRSSRLVSRVLGVLSRCLVGIAAAGLLLALVTVAAVATRPLDPAGSHMVNYRLTSAGTAAAAPDTGDDVPVWPFVAGTVVAVGAAALWAMRRGP